MLEGRGADLFMLETFFDLEELADAIAAVRSVSSLPIVALMTFDEDARDARRRERRRGGRAARELWRSRRSARTTAPGCSPRSRRSSRCRATGLPLAALPNIGLASLLGGRVVYPHATPEYFAEFAAHARDLGARVIGGCCGTTPTEIAAISAAVDAGAAARTRLDADARDVAVALGEERRETRLAAALREGEFVVSVQLDPPLGGSSRGLLEVARRARGLGARPVRRRQRQRDGPRRHQRADGVRARSSARRASRRSRT